MSVLRGLLSKVSVEPVVFLYFVTMFLSNILSTNLLLYKACDPTDATGQQMGSKCVNETEAQHVVAPINGWKALVQQLVPIVLVMIAGTWSDRHGQRRRPLIVLPLIGQTVADALSLYCAFEWSVSPQTTAAIQAVAIGFTGGAPMLFNGVNAYVADTTTDKWRTVKFGVVNGMSAGGALLGIIIYVCLVANVGFVFAFTVLVGLDVVIIALAYIFINDTCTVYTEAEQWPVDKLPLYQEVIYTINPMNVLRNCYRMLTKQRKENDTVVLCLVVLLCAPLTSVPMEGELSVMYLFLRYKFQWNEVEFSIFFAYLTAWITLGTVFALAILIGIYQMSDALIGMLASIFDLLAAIAFLVISKSWQLYLVPPLDVFRGAAFALANSLASKCVGPDELGAMNSVKLLMEGTMKSLFIPLYNFTYNHTFEVMPSAFFLISIVLTVPLVFIFCLIYYLNRKPLSNTPDNNVVS